MTTSIFSGTLSSGTLTAGQFLLLFAAAIALGLIIALVYSRCGDCTKSFAVTLALLPGYWLGKISKTAVKERMYGFLRRVPDVDAELEAFWAKNFDRVNPWYLAQQRPDDIIISASPEFLVRIPAQKLGVRLLASRVDKHTGKTDGENCHGAEKVRRLHEAYPEVQIAEFYSDSRSDSPLAELAERAYLVHGQERTPW